MENTIQKTAQRNPWIARWTTPLLLGLIMCIGYYFADIISSSKYFIDSQYGWDEATWTKFSKGGMLASFSLLFVVIAGFISDKKGIRSVAILSGLLMTIGAFTEYYAFTEGYGLSRLHSFFEQIQWAFFRGMPSSARLASVGNMLFEAGLEATGLLIVLCIIRRFDGKELALALGVELTIAKVGIYLVYLFIPSLVSLPFIYNIPRILFVGAILILLVSVLFIVCCGHYDWKDAPQTPLPPDSSSFSNVFLPVFRSRIFWGLALFNLVYYAVLYSFNSNADILIDSYGVDGIDISFLNVLIILLPFVFIQFICAYLDLKGHAISVLIGGASAMLLSFLILFLIVPPTRSQFLVVLSYLLLGVSYTMLPAAIWPTVSRVVDRRVLGTSLGILFWLQSLGMMVLPPVMGFIHESTNTGMTMLAYVVLGVVSLLLGFLILLESKAHRYDLELPNIR